MGCIAEQMGMLVPMNIYLFISHNFAVFHSVNFFGCGFEKIDIMGYDHVGQINFGEYGNQLVLGVLVQSGYGFI